MKSNEAAAALPTKGCSQDFNIISGTGNANNLQYVVEHDHTIKIHYLQPRVMKSIQHVQYCKWEKNLVLGSEAKTRDSPSFRIS
jgi:hypothetical protein